MRGSGVAAVADGRRECEVRQESVAGDGVHVGLLSSWLVPCTCHGGGGAARAAGGGRGGWV